MKRHLWIIGVGALLMVSAYFGYPALFERFGSYAARQYRSPRERLGDVGPIYRCAQQPGLAFFTDLDEVKFTFYLRFDSIEITARKPYRKKESLLVAVQRFPENGPDGQPRVERSEKLISPEVFLELQQLVLRQDLIDRSLVGHDIACDGSSWILEGRKGDFVISHYRESPVVTKDKIYVAIGLRFLELADIKIPDDKLY